MIEISNDLKQWTIEQEKAWKKTHIQNCVYATLAIVV